MLFKGKRFFSTFKEGGLSAILKSSDRCIVQRVVMGSDRKYAPDYAFFESWECFYIWYLNLRNDERTFHEVITEGPQKFRLDVDCLSEKWNFESKYEVVYLLCSYIRKVLGLDTELIIYESVDPDRKKYSFHIVTKNIALESSFQCRMVAEIIRSWFIKPEIIDLSIYKTFQCFRLEGSTKPGCRRFKYIIDTKFISNCFLDGIISNTKNCRAASLMLPKRILAGFTPETKKKYVKSNYSSSS
jgi:hypothetical protein